jgi:hypothetical protein
MKLLATAIVSWGFAPSLFLSGIVATSVHFYVDPLLHTICGLYVAQGLVFTAWVALVLTHVVLATLGPPASGCLV